jgi:hypothetical protein
MNGRAEGRFATRRAEIGSCSGVTDAPVFMVGLLCGMRRWWLELDCTRAPQNCKFGDMIFTMFTSIFTCVGGKRRRDSSLRYAAFGMTGCRNLLRAQRRLSESG